MATLQEAIQEIEQTAGVLAVADRQDEIKAGVAFHALTVVEEAGSEIRTTLVRYAVVAPNSPGEQAKPIGSPWVPYSAPTPDDVTQPLVDFIDSDLPAFRGYTFRLLDLENKVAILDGYWLANTGTGAGANGTNAERRSLLFFAAGGAIRWRVVTEPVTVTQQLP